MAEQICAKCGAKESPSDGGAASAACATCGGPWMISTGAPEQAAEVPLEAELARDFVLTADCPAGTAILGIEFLNDYYDEKTGEDRNLKVHRVTLKKAR